MFTTIPVIIPHYGQPGQLRRCLEHLQAQSHPLEPRVIDNNSANRGFTRAVNVGLRQVLDRELVLQINQDVYLHPDAVAQALHFMAEHPACAIGGFKQLSAEDPDRIVHGGGGRAYPAGEHLGGQVSAGDCAASACMPWVNGAAWILRTAALREFGLLDEGMFLFGSDSDLCYTARLRGWECWYIAEALCLHEGGVSTQKRSPELQAILQRDMQYWADKWVGSRAFLKLSTTAVPLQERSP